MKIQIAKANTGGQITVQILNEVACGQTSVGFFVLSPSEAFDLSVALNAVMACGFKTAEQIKISEPFTTV